MPTDDPLFGVFVLAAACAVVAVVGWVAGQLISVVIEALYFG